MRNRQISLCLCEAQLSHRVPEVVGKQAHVRPRQRRVNGPDPVVVAEAKAEIPHQISLRRRQSHLLQIPLDDALGHRHSPSLPPAPQLVCRFASAERQKLRLQLRRNTQHRACDVIDRHHGGYVVFVH